MNRRLTGVAFAALVSGACSPTHERSDHSFASELVGDSYDLVVYTPVAGAGPFPLLVFQDGDYLAAREAELRRLTADGAIPPVVVLGVAYQDGSTGLTGGLSDETMDRRARDFTPRPIQGVPDSGGAADFQAFLAQELLPWAESELPVLAGADGRATYGFSAFGLSILYGVLTTPGTFRGHCAASPSVGTDGGVIFDLAAQADPNLAAGWLQISSGTDEGDHAAIQDFADQVAQHGHAELDLLTETWDGKNHRQSMAPSFEACLQALTAE